MRLRSPGPISPDTYSGHIRRRALCPNRLRNGMSQRSSSSCQSDILPTMVGPSKSRPPMSHRKTDLGIPCRSKSAKVVLGFIHIWGSRGRLYTTLNCASCALCLIDSLTAMVQETIKARTRTVKPNEIYGKGEDQEQEQEQMIEEALSAIRKIGAAAVLERCRMVADLIDAQLEGVNSEQFANTSSGS